MLLWESKVPEPVIVPLAVVLGSGFFVSGSPP